MVTFTPPSPETLNSYFINYDITSFIAQGGMGAVYQGKQVSLDRAVAIKILPPELVTNNQYFKLFESEAKSLARLNHPNLVGIYDFGEVNGMFYIVMEYVPGRSLFTITNGLSVEEKEAAYLISEICKGLSHAHDHGILHRDIKPGNILIDDFGHPKLVDFGLAMSSKGIGQGQHALGTPGYAAPEITSNPSLIDQRADIFSVGVLLYELLIGHLPSQPFIPASRVNDTDQRFDYIINKALHPVPAMRYETCAAMALDIDSLITNWAVNPHHSSGTSTQVLQNGVLQLNQPISPPGIQTYNAPPQLLSRANQSAMLLHQPSSQPVLHNSPPQNAPMVTAQSNQMASPPSYNGGNAHFSQQQYSTPTQTLYVNTGNPTVQHTSSEYPVHPNYQTAAYQPSQQINPQPEYNVGNNQTIPQYEQFSTQTLQTNTVQNQINTGVLSVPSSHLATATSVPMVGNPTTSMLSPQQVNTRGLGRSATTATRLPQTSESSGTIILLITLFTVISLGITGIVMYQNKITAEADQKTKDRIEQNKKITAAIAAQELENKERRDKITADRAAEKERLKALNEKYLAEQREEEINLANKAIEENTAPAEQDKIEEVSTSELDSTTSQEPTAEQVTDQILEDKTVSNGENAIPFDSKEFINQARAAIEPQMEKIHTKTTKKLTNNIKDLEDLVEDEVDKLPKGARNEAEKLANETMSELSALSRLPNNAPDDAIAPIIKHYTTAIFQQDGILKTAEDQIKIIHNEYHNKLNQQIIKLRQTENNLEIKELNDELEITNTIDSFSRQFNL